MPIESVSVLIEQLTDAAKRMKEIREAAQRVRQLRQGAEPDPRPLPPILSQPAPSFTGQFERPNPTP